MKQKGFAPIIILVMIAVVAIAGAYYLGSQNSSSNNSQVVPSPNTSASAGLNSTTNTISGSVFTNSKYNYSLTIPNDWKPERAYPGGEYTDTQLQQMDSNSWKEGDLSFSIQVLADCTNLNVCFSDFQKTADIQGGPYTTSKTQTVKGTFQSRPSMVARSTYGGSDNTVKGTFFVYKGKLWLVETQSLPASSAQFEKTADNVLTSLKLN